MTQLIVQTGIFGDGMFGDRPETDLDGVLDDARTAGYDGVEVMANLIAEPARLRDACAARDMEIAALHVFWWERDSPKVLDALQVLDTDRLLLSCLPVKEPADVTDVVAGLRETSAAARDLGVSVLLHNHAPECRVMSDGRTPYEALGDQLTADEVGFAIDLHWAAVSGTLLRTIRAVGPRCDYYHFKDGSLTDPKNGRSCDLGEGKVDLRGAWELIRVRPPAVAAVERGFTPADQPAALRHDAAYVRKLLAEVG